jgi:hypothetical protein
MNRRGFFGRGLAGFAAALGWRNVLPSARPVSPWVPPVPSKLVTPTWVTGEVTRGFMNEITFVNKVNRKYSLPRTWKESE